MKQNKIINEGNFPFKNQNKTKSFDSPSQTQKIYTIK